MKTSLIPFVKLFITLFILLVVFSCSSSDEEEEDLPVALAGRWNISAIILENPYDFNNNGTASANLLDEVPCFNETFIQINANGTGIFSNEFVQLETEIINGANFNYLFECFDFEDEIITWAQNGNIITLVNENINLNAEVNGDVMTVVLVNNFTVPLYDGETVSETIEDVLLIYEKQ